MAYYDERPSRLAAVGNGSYLYRYNIKEVQLDNMAGPDDPGDPVTQWQCDEVTVWPPLSPNKITEAVISAFCPASHEQKLVNEYNAANLGMVGASKSSAEAKERIAAYKAFLASRAALKAQVDADCAALGIV